MNIRGLCREDICITVSLRGVLGWRFHCMYAQRTKMLDRSQCVRFQPAANIVSEHEQGQTMQ